MLNKEKKNPRNRITMLCCAMLSHFSDTGLFVTLWTVVRQAPLSMGFSRQEYWSGLPFPSPGEEEGCLPDPRIKPGSPELQADVLLSEPPGKPSQISLTSRTPFCKVVAIVWPLSHVQFFCDPTDQSLPSSSAHGDSLGKNIGVGCHAQLQGIFPMQGSNPCLLNWQASSLLSEPLK